MVRRADVEIVCSGTVDGHTADELAERCGRLADSGVHQVLLDLSGVTRCDEAGMIGLAELREGWCGLEVRLVGVGWWQVVSTLAQADPDQFDGLYRTAQSLLAVTGNGNHRAHRRAHGRT